MRKFLSRPTLPGVPSGYYPVDEILDAQRRRNVLYLLLRWSNYSNDHDSWEPYSNCNDALKEYYHSKATRFSQGSLDMSTDEPKERSHKTIARPTAAKGSQGSLDMSISP